MPYSTSYLLHTCTGRQDPFCLTPACTGSYHSWGISCTLAPFAGGRRRICAGCCLRPLEQTQRQEGRTSRSWTARLGGQTQRKDSGNAPPQCFHFAENNSARNSAQGRGHALEGHALQDNVRQAGGLAGVDSRRRRKDGTDGGALAHAANTLHGYAPVRWHLTHSLRGTRGALLYKHALPRTCSTTLLSPQTSLSAARSGSDRRISS